MTENIINKKEIKTDTMKKSERVSYSAIGGAIIAVSSLFLLALTATRVENNILPFIVVVVTIVLGFFLIWTAYKT